MVQGIIEPLRRQAQGLLELRFVRRAQSSALVRSAATLAGLAAVGQAITVACTPLLSRIYSPEDLGAFGVITAFIAAVSVASCLNFEAAIPSAANQEEAVSILLGAVSLAAVTSVAFGTIYAALTIADVAGYVLMPLWSAVLVAACLWLSAVTSSLHYWSMRQGDFQIMGSAAISMNLVRITLQLGAGALGYRWVGLAGGEAVGRTASSIHFLAKQRRNIRAHWGDQSASQVWRALVNHKRFATVLLPSMLADQILSTISIPIISGLFGLAAAGQYFFMRRVLDLPLAVVGRTVGDAFHHRISEEVQNNPTRVRPLLVRVFIWIAIPAALASLPVIIAGPEIFAFVFGEPWRQSGLFAALTLPSLVINLGVNPISRIFWFTRRTGLRYVFTIVNGCGMTVVLTAAWLTSLSLTTVVAALSAVSFVAYVSYLAAAYLAAGVLSTEVSRS